MTISRLNKKLIFLHYEKNKLWEKYSHSAPSKEKIKFSELVDKCFGQNANLNISRWKADPNIRPNFVGSKWSEKICEVLDIELRNDLFLEHVPSSELGQLLGLSRSSCRYLVDKFYVENHPMINSIIYEKNIVESFIDSVAGVYEITMDVPGMNTTYSASLQIRYFLPVDPRAKIQKFRVRCKLNILKAHESLTAEESGIVEYDGYLAYIANHMYFIFESRPFFNGRRILTLSFSGLPVKIDGKAYFVGGYSRSEPLTGAKKSFGSAMMRSIYRDRSTIRPDSDLTRFNSEPEAEAFMLSLPARRPYDSLDPEFTKTLQIRDGD